MTSVSFPSKNSLLLSVKTLNLYKKIEAKDKDKWKGDQSGFGWPRVLTASVRVTSSYRRISSFLRATWCQFTSPKNPSSPCLPELRSPSCPSQDCSTPLRAMGSIGVVFALILKQRKLKTTLLPKRQIFSGGFVSSGKLLSFLTFKLFLMKEIFVK